MLQHINGDATRLTGDGKKILIHICNNEGKWGKGFVLSISAKWKSPEMEYRRWHKDGQTPSSGSFVLGNVQFVKVEDKLFIANMIAQHGVGIKSGMPPIRYDALEKCLRKVYEKAKLITATIHLPYLIGCGLAGGDHNTVLKMIKDIFTDIDVYTYKLEQG